MRKLWVGYISSFILVTGIIFATCSTSVAAVPDGGVSINSVSLAGEVIVTSRLIKDQLVLEIDKTLKLQGDLHSLVRLSCKQTEKDTGFLCGYALQHAASAVDALLWGGAWSEKGWNDPLQLVRLPGAADGGTRLRLSLLASDASMDIGAQHVAARWERQSGTADENALLGVLALWGTYSEETDEDVCEEDPLHEACGDNATESNMLEPDLMNISTDVQATSTFGFNRAVAYVAAETPGWRWQSALAGAACESACTLAAAGFSVRYNKQNLRTELYTKYEDGGYRKPDSPVVFVLQPTLALTRGSLTTEVRLRAEGEDLAIRVWRFILAGRRGITVNQVNSVYTPHQVKTAKKAAWRALLEIHNNPTGASETCGAEPCPWMWPDDSISAWTLQVEGVFPTVIGHLGARLKLGESRNGRLNWWYTRPSGERALSSQSHIGVTLETDYYRQVGAWEYQLSLLFSEEIRFRFNSWERPDAYYWCIEPKVSYISNNYILSGGLNWAKGTEYDGVTYTDCVPVLELILNL